MTAVALWTATMAVVTLALWALELWWERRREQRRSERSMREKAEQLRLAMRMARERESNVRLFRARSANRRRSG